MDSEGKESPGYSSKIEDLSTHHIEAHGSGSIFIKTEAIAASLWQQMIEATQQDYKERGVVVSKSGKKFYTSRVFEGTGEQIDYKNSDKISATSSFNPPLLPQGIRSLIPGMKDIVVVHTHPMPPKLDHLSTTPLSDIDIHAFVNAQHNGLVMIDRGGAHLLVRTRTSYNDSDLLKKNIVDEAVEVVKRNDGVVLDVIKATSQQLANYGLGYFYTQTLLPNIKGFVEFNNPRSLK